MLTTAGLHAQTLGVSSVMAAPGGKAMIEVTLESPPGKAPLSLQWDLIVPAQTLLLQGAPQVSAQARQAGKSITCAGRWVKAPVSYAYRCVLVGGERPVPNGALAVFNFQVAPKTQPGKAVIRVEAAKAASATLKSVNVKTGAGAVVISVGGK